MLALEALKGLVIIDEVQHAPELFRVLRVLADCRRRPARFLVLGSASPDLLRQSSETLAGRISHYEFPGFSLAEVGSRRLERLWIRGGFPRAYLARSNEASMGWRRDFIRTFLERDIPQLGITVAAATMRLRRLATPFSLLLRLAARTGGKALTASSKSKSGFKLAGGCQLLSR